MLQYLYIFDETSEREVAEDESIKGFLRRMAVKSFNTLYNTASKIGKLVLLDRLSIDPEAALYYLGVQNREELCDAIAQRVDGLLKEFNGGERNIAVSLLYSGLAACYVEMNEFDKSKKYAGEALEAVKNISVDDYEKVRPYLEVWFMRPDINEELDLLRQVVYRRLSHAYLVMGKVDEAEKHAWEACKIAKELSEVEDMLKSCVLAYSINAAKTGNWNTEKFEELYSKAEEQKLVDKHLEYLVVWEFLISSVCESLGINSGELSRLMEKIEMKRASPLLLVDRQFFDTMEGNLHHWNSRMIYPYRIDSELIDALNKKLEHEPEELTRALNIVFKAGLHIEEGAEEVGIKISLPKEVYSSVDDGLIRSIINLPIESIYSLIMFGLAHCRHRESRWGCKLAEVLAEISSQKLKGTVAQSLSELAKAIEIRDWSKIMREVCRLYFLFSAYHYRIKLY